MVEPTTGIELEVVGITKGRPALDPTKYELGKTIEDGKPLVEPTTGIELEVVGVTKGRPVLDPTEDELSKPIEDGKPSVEPTTDIEVVGIMLDSSPVVPTSAVLEAWLDDRGIGGAGV